MSNDEAKKTESRFPWKEILALLGVIVAAYIGYLGVRSQIEIPIQATQTAEARLGFSTTPISSPTSSVPFVRITDPPEGAELAQRYVDVQGIWERKPEEGQELWLYVHDRSARKFYLVPITTLNNGTLRANGAYIGAPQENGTEYKLGIIIVSSTESQKLNSDFIELLELPFGAIKLTEITIFRRPYATPTP
jgi:hypothetical protein